MAISHKHRFNVDDYLRIAHAEALGERRVELINGAIVDVPPQGPAHVSLVARLTQYFTRVAGDDALVFAQLPVVLRPDSMPEPDFALMRVRRDFYHKKEPSPEDILLVVEVADSSLGFDRTIKARLYATHNIVEYWIVDVRARAIIVARSPQQGTYTDVQTIASGEIAPLELSKLHFSIPAIFAHLDQ